MHTTYKGPYEKLPDVWGKTMKWMTVAGYEPCGVPVGIEQYLNNPAEVPESELLTDIWVPIKKPSEKRTRDDDDDISLKPFDARRIVTCSRECKFADMPAFIKEAMPAVGKLAGASIIGAPFTFYGPPGDVMNVNVAVPVAADFVLAPPADNPLAIAVQDMPKHDQCIAVVHKGSYDSMMGSWKRVHTWMKEHDMQLAANISGIEVYMSDPADTAEADLITELFAPVTAAEKKAKTAE